MGGSLFNWPEGSALQLLVFVCLVMEGALVSLLEGSTLQLLTLLTSRWVVLWLIGPRAWLGNFWCCSPRDGWFFGYFSRGLGLATFDISCFLYMEDGKDSGGWGVVPRKTPQRKWLPLWLCVCKTGGAFPRALCVWLLELHSVTTGEAMQALSLLW